MNKKLKLDNQLCFPIYAASRLITQMYAPYFKQHDLTYPQYLVFLLLWEKTPRTIGDIATHLLLDTGTVTPLLKRMESASWIERRRNPEDERSVMAYLTDKGRRLEQHFMDVPDQLICSLDCKKNEFENLKDDLKKLIDKMQTALEGGYRE